jgi:divalent metal cation (Fe/Co/Zn/Cd) transporter
MRNPALFIGSLIVAVIALALGVFYLVPGIYHPLTFGSHPPMDTQPTHAIVFFIVAVLLVLVALINRPRPASRY